MNTRAIIKRDDILSLAEGARIKVHFYSKDNRRQKPRTYTVIGKANEYRAVPIRSSGGAIGTIQLLAIYGVGLYGANNRQIGKRCEVELIEQ